mgnify:CR=1 FL=1
MIVDSIAIAEFPLFSKLDRTLSSGKENFTEFLQWPQDISSFQKIIESRKSFTTNREVLVKVLQDQYRTLGEKCDSIEMLLSPKTFTITTAHQPSLFTGPVFVISKAISAIKLAKQVKEQNPAFDILPVFVMGSEDHDVEELNNTQINGSTLVWSTDQRGPVGRFNLQGIESLLQELDSLSLYSQYHAEIIDLFTKAYSLDTFGQAFQYLLIKVLGQYGLIVLNTDDQRLKEVFRPYLMQEIMGSISKSQVNQTQQKLYDLGYDAAAFARDINVFYFGNGYREKIEREGDTFQVPGKERVFSKDEMIHEIQEHPERFSPNVVMRPLYQEILLPNLAYVGGGGELAYWLERKSQFTVFNVPYPMLVRRDSFMIIEPDQFKLLKQYQVRIEDLAMRSDLFVNTLAASISEHQFDLTRETNTLLAEMDKLKEKAIAMDTTLGPTVEGEKSKLIKSIEYIEKKMLKAEKVKLEIHLNKVKKVKDKLMPDNSLLERKENYLTFYLKYGRLFIDTLLKDFNPLDNQFKVIEIGE